MEIETPVNNSMDMYELKIQNLIAKTKSDLNKIVDG